jgi:hypothetical protein
VADEARAPETAAAPPRDPEALRAYLVDRLNQALTRPRLLGAEGVQMARGIRAYLSLLSVEGLRTLSDCFAAVGDAPAAAAQPAGDLGVRDRLVRCIDATSRRPLIWFGQDWTDMQNHRGYLQSLQGDDLARMEGYRGEGG